MTNTAHTLIEDEALANTKFHADLADKIRAEGPSALDGLDIEFDETIEDFIAALLEDYPAGDSAA